MRVQTYKCRIVCLSPSLCLCAYQCSSPLPPYWAVDGDNLYGDLTEDSAPVVRNFITSDCIVKL